YNLVRNGGVLSTRGVTSPDMIIREPAVAGMFYPKETKPCLAQLQYCIDRSADAPAGIEAPRDIGRIVGGVVPHAGWVCSGAVAPRVIRQIAAQRKPAVVIIFGAIHVPLFGPHGYVFPSGAWETPLGMARVDDRLVDRLCGQTSLL